MKANEMELKDYLGDSVYAEFDGDYIVLTTNNGYDDDPRNTIALEPSVFSALVRFVGRLPEQAGFQFIANHDGSD